MNYFLNEDSYSLTKSYMVTTKDQLLEIYTLVKLWFPSSSLGTFFAEVPASHVLREAGASLQHSQARAWEREGK